MIIIPENFKANNFTNSDKECKKAFELLRRVYDVIEKSHLNDHNAYFIKNVIRRQKNFRQKQKNKFKSNIKNIKK